MQEPIKSDVVTFKRELHDAHEGEEGPFHPLFVQTSCVKPSLSCFFDDDCFPYGFPALQSRIQTLTDLTEPTETRRGTRKKDHSQARRRVMLDYLGYGVKASIWK